LRSSIRGTLFCLLLATSCGRGVAGAETVKPEPVDGLVLYDSYGELVEAVLKAQLAGDEARVRASIATAGQLETMCHDYPAPGVNPYTVPSIPEGSKHCREVFAPFAPESIEKALETHALGRKHTPAEDGSFTTHWGPRCPANFRVYSVPEVLEFEQEGQAKIGFEVSDVFTLDGKWGLMSIPRCRGEGE
jgi:hypothetical protein